MKVFSVIEEQGNQLWVCQCGEEACEPSHSFGPAVRDHYLIHYITKGKGVFTTSRGEHKLGEGQGFLICPEETTIYTADASQPWEYCWVGFKGIDAKAFVESCGLSLEEPIFTCKSGEVIKTFFREMYESSQDAQIREYTMIGYLYLIMAHIKSQNRSFLKHNKSIDLYYEKAKQYIKNNYSYDISVGILAKHIGIDRTYLYRIFKEKADVSPERYILQVRLSKAKELLEYPDYSIYEVALSTGFKEISSFSKAFKKIYGVSPSIYRKR